MRKKLAAFFIFTFTLTWGIAALLILFPEQVTAIFGELSPSNPLFILAVYAPGIVGTLLVWQTYGFSGLRSFFQRLTLWRGPMVAWLFTLLGIPTVMYLGAWLSGNSNEPFSFSPLSSVLSALALALFLGPIEEFGWRGFALPLMQRRLAPFWAGMILGIIWMVWHIPAFLIGGTPQSAWSFLPFFAGGIAISLILTIWFNEFRGSLLLAVLFHFQLNNPIWPDAQPWDTILILCIAGVLVWTKRHTIFKKESGVTDILMPVEQTKTPTHLPLMEI